MDLKFTDIHVHSILKPYICNKYPEGTEKTIWDRFDERKKDLKKLCFIIRNQAKEVAKASQANLDSCVDANLKCIFISLYPVERQWFDIRIKNVRPWWTRLAFRLLLPKWKYHHLGAALSGLPSEFVKKIMSRIKDNKGIDYFNEELLELINYTISQTGSTSKKYPYYSFKIATDYSEYSRLIREDKTICGILTVEGAASLGNYRSNSTLSMSFTALAMNEYNNLAKDFEVNINVLKNAGNERYTPLFISLCHHYNNLLAGHSKSLVSFKGLVDQTPGLDSEINNLGKKVIDLLLSRENGRRILIDTKHMSILSRKCYHGIVREKRSENDNIPIIQSHAAISGIETFSLALECDEDDPEFDKDTYFSNWRVNMNDEELLDIYDSDGIIGIVFHEDRMPGGYVKSQTKKLSNRFHRLEKKKHMTLRQQNELNNIKEELKLIYVQLIWSNIFHIIRLIYKERSAMDAWKIISFGSDYDGMIDPFDGYYSVGDLPDLFNDMIDYVKKGRGPIYYADKNATGDNIIKCKGIARFEKSELEGLMFGRTIEDIMQDICFNNVDLFLSKYFTLDYLK